MFIIWANAILFSAYRILLAATLISQRKKRAMPIDTIKELIFGRVLLVRALKE